MNISILGAGNIGGSLARIWAERGHTITVGVRDLGSEKAQKLAAVSPVTLTDFDSAVEASEVIVIALSFPAVEAVLKSLRGSLQNKIILDTTNALPEAPAGFASAAEAIRTWTGCERVVKVFNSTGSYNLNHPDYNGTPYDALICGDDTEAKALATRLAHETGCAVVDVGGLDQAPLLEALAKLWINLAYKQGLGANIAFHLLRR